MQIITEVEDYGSERSFELYAKGDSVFLTRLDGDHDFCIEFSREHLHSALVAELG